MLEHARPSASRPLLPRWCPGIARDATLALLVTLAGSSARAQQRPVAPASPSAFPEPRNWTTAQDHHDMMQQLGINPAVLKDSKPPAPAKPQ